MNNGNWPSAQVPAAFLRVTIMPCDHLRKRLVWADVGTGGDPMSRRELRHQCPDCGKLFAGSRAHALAKADTPEVDKEKLRECNERANAEWRDFERRKAEESAAWWATYNDYLQSDAWYQLRPLVFQRPAAFARAAGRRKRPWSIT
jgi:hypothetical protein